MVDGPMLVCVVALVSGQNAPTPVTYLDWTPPPGHDGFVRPGVFDPKTHFDVTAQLPNVGAGVTGGITPTPKNGDNPCNCGGLGRNATWHSEDDTSFDGRRCRAPRFGWTWSEQSGDDTEPIVMTIPPGDPQTVRVSGRNAHFLTSSTNELGQPCGIVTQDILQGLPSHDGLGIQLGPSAIPSSLYCSHPTTPYWQSPPKPPLAPGVGTEGSGVGGTAADVEGVSGGSIWRQGWHDLELATTLEIDAVCQCSLGALASVFELSGVVFSTPNLNDALSYNNNELTLYASSSVLEDRATETATLTGGWAPSTTYDAPTHFYCREDYVLYWLLRIAFTAVYDTTSPLNDLYTTVIRPLSQTSPDDYVKYWRYYYAAGLDCQRRLTHPTSEDDVLATCQTTGTLANQFITNNSYYVGLDIGQLFYQFNLSEILSVSEDDLSLDDPDVDKVLWAMASTRRRSPENLASGAIRYPDNPEELYTPNLVVNGTSLTIESTYTNPSQPNDYVTFGANDTEISAPNFYESVSPFPREGMNGRGPAWTHPWRGRGLTPWARLP